MVRTSINSDCTGGYLVAECPANIGNRIEDARLIAAAPELLEALQAIIALDDKVDPEGFFRGIESIKARAAIAKATGK
jgi:hypothetical protein